ncbi:MAG: glutamylcysteine synthetase, partial [Clostridia bacterium]|nr:glutamylcysteine synthetase [Clostridia bacterium]
PEDISYLRTFKFEDLTYRGTIEFRSGCCQPISDVMTVSAFHLGLLNKTAELSELMKNDRSLYNNGYNAVELRKQLVCCELPAYIDTDGLYELAKDVLDLCKAGLTERGFGEEIYLAPLYERIEKRTNPARTMLERLKNGTNINEIVKEYGRISIDRFECVQ